MLVCLLVNQHPSPLDDCPRFEDAIAFISVVLGSRELLDSKRVAALNAGLFASVTPGAAFDLPALVTTWVLLALLKVTTGILVVLSWRMLAKPIVRTPPPAPPLFRYLPRARPVGLSHRRHYTLATEYSRGPPHMLGALPSMIDLDFAMAEVVDEAGGVTSGRERRSAGAAAIMR